MLHRYSLILTLIYSLFFSVDFYGFKVLIVTVSQNPLRNLKNAHIPFLRHFFFFVEQKVLACTYPFEKVLLLSHAHKAAFISAALLLILRLITITLSLCHYYI